MEYFSVFNKQTL